jgi:hypothetical protein
MMKNRFFFIVGILTVGLLIAGCGGKKALIVKIQPDDDGSSFHFIEKRIDRCFFSRI